MGDAQHPTSSLPTRTEKWPAPGAGPNGGDELRRKATGGREADTRPRDDDLLGVPRTPGASGLRGPGGAAGRRCWRGGHCGSKSCRAWQRRSGQLGLPRGASGMRIAMRLARVRLSHARVEDHVDITKDNSFSRSAPSRSAGAGASSESRCVTHSRWTPGCRTNASRGGAICCTRAGHVRIRTARDQYPHLHDVAPGMSAASPAERHTTAR